MSPGWGRMLGWWCDARHPALAQFPTAGFSDWQWIEMARGTRAINLDGLPAALTPIVQAVDDWNRNWRLGLVFEARVGAGRLLVCAFDLDRDLASRPVARQLRASLLAYAAGPSFAPATEVPEAALASCSGDARLMAKLGATAQAGGQNAAAVLDGDPNTYWVIGAPVRGAAVAPHPHALTVRFSQPVTMRGVVLMNRQNDREHQGDIRGYRLEAMTDAQTWRVVAAGELASTWEPQTLPFATPVTTDQLRLTALSGFGPDPSAALAELSVLYAGNPLPENDDAPVGYRRVRSTSADVEETPPPAEPGTAAASRTKSSRPRP